MQFAIPPPFAKGESGSFCIEITAEEEAEEEENENDAMTDLAVCALFRVSFSRSSKEKTRS